MSGLIGTLLGHLSLSSALKRRQPRPRRQRPLYRHLRLQPFQSRPPVGQAGQRIDERKLFELSRLILHYKNSLLSFEQCKFAFERQPGLLLISFAAFLVNRPAGLNQEEKESRGTATHPDEALRLALVSERQNTRCTGRDGGCCDGAFSSPALGTVDDPGTGEQIRGSMEGRH